MCSLSPSDDPREILRDRARQQRLVDRTTYLWIQDLLIGKRVSAHTKDANRLWRSRYSQRWDRDDPHVEFMEAMGAPHTDASVYHPPVARAVDEQRAAALQVAARFFDQASQPLDPSGMRGLEEATDKALADRAAQIRFVNNIVHATLAALPVARAPAPRKAARRQVVLQGVTAAVASKALKALTATVPFAVPVAADAPSVGRNATAASPAHTLLRAMMSRPRPPSADQYRILVVFADYIDALVRGESPPPPRIFMHGAGGTGKSFVLQCIDELFGTIGQHVVPCALTGVACAAISCRDPARTLHYTCQLNAETLAPIANLKAHDEEFMKDRFACCGLLVVDEVSFSSVRALSGISQRMALLRPDQHVDDPFRGMPVLLSGDLHQLPGVGDALYNAYFHHSSKHDATRVSGQTALSGAQLLKTFRMLRLNQNKRCKDPVHLAMLDSMRAGRPEGLKRYLLEHVLTRDDVVSNPAWANAPIIVAGNAERIELNAVLAERFAVTTGQVLVEWQLPFSIPPPPSKLNGKTLQPTTVERDSGGTAIKFDAVRAAYGEEKVADVYAHTKDLTFRFVAGAPGQLLANLNPSRGAANGIACEFHSLTFSDKDRERAKMLIDAGRPGETVLLPPGMIPTHVNVRLIGPGAPDSLERQAWIASWADATLVKGDVVIPVPKFTPRKPATAYSNNGASMKVKAERPEVDLAFSTTIHKAQGSSLEYVIISPYDLEYHALYVALSRVFEGANFRILAPVYSGSLDYLDSLTPPAK